MLTRENYFEFNNFEDQVVISNSSLGYINPDEGGSLKRFMNFIQGAKEKEESKSLERGSLLHKYLEDHENFVIAPEDAPSEAICSMLERMRDEIIRSGRNPGELADHTDEIVQIARAEKFGGNWSSATVITRVRAKGDAYFKHLNEADGKFMTDAKTKAILEGITDQLKTDPYTLDNYIYTPPGVMKELPVLFYYNDMWCKGLLDNVFIDFESKKVKINDIKSTSKPVGNYMGSRMILMPGVTHHMPGAFQYYRTYRQLAFYTEAAKAWLAQNGEDPNWYSFEWEVLACETIEPYEHGVYPISQDWINEGKEEMNYCIDIIKGGLAYGT